MGKPRIGRPEAYMVYLKLFMYTFDDCHFKI